MDGIFLYQIGHFFFFKLDTFTGELIIIYNMPGGIKKCLVFKPLRLMGGGKMTFCVFCPHLIHRTGS